MKKSVLLILYGICWLTGFYQIILGQSPELVVKSGHFGYVETLTFSSDGKLLASGSEDKTIKLWDVLMGVELRTFVGHSAKISSLAFSPDGKLLASGSHDGTIKVWEIATGKVIKTQKQRSSDNTDLVNSVAFSPDGKILASAGNDIKLWNVATGEIVRTIDILAEDFSKDFYNLSFSFDGKQLFSVYEGSIKIWNVESGLESRTVNKFAKDETLITYNLVGETFITKVNDKKFKISNLNSETEITNLVGDLDGVNFASFSLDGKNMATANDDNTVKIWDLNLRKEIKNLVGHLKAVDCVAFSPNSQLLASGGRDNSLKLWDVATGKVIYNFDGNSTNVNSIALSNDGKFLANGSDDDTIKIWDLKNGSVQKTLKENSSAVCSLVFSADGKTLASRSYDGLTLWDIATAQRIGTVEGSHQNECSIAFSPDNKKVAGIFGGHSIKIIDAESGNEMQTFSENPKAITSLGFSADSKLLVSGGYDATVKLWDVTTGREIKSFDVNDNSTAVYSAAISPDGNFAAAGCWDYVKIWDVKSGVEIMKILQPVLTARLSFSPDNKTLVSIGYEDSIRFWDVKSGSETAYKKLPDWVSFDGYLAVGKINGEIVKAVRDGAKINLINLDTKEIQASLISITKNDWLITTPEGFFDGTPSAWKQLIWRFNDNTFDFAPVETYFNDYFYPNLLQDVLNGNSPKPKAGQELEKIDRRQPKVEIASTVNTDKRTTTVTIEVADNVDKKKQPDHQETSGAQDLRLFRNGSLVKVWRGDVFDKASGCEEIKSNKSRRVRCQTQVSIVADENIFTAYAFNSSNVKSNDDVAIIKGADALKRSGTFYVLAVGVDKYKDASRNLKYAVADIDSISAELVAQQTKLTNKQYAKTEIIKFTDDNATKENILLALKRFTQNGDKVGLPNNPAIQKELAKIQPTQPEDALIIYYAGHGTASKDRFYLIPHDGFPKETTISEKSLEELYRNSISDEDLEKVLETVDVGKMLMVIDACNSGQALNSEEQRRGPMNSRGLAQLAYEKGMYILTAAQSQQAALEVTKLGHGLLTFSLLEGMQKAEKETDGAIVERKWLDFAVAEVPQLQLEEMQKRDVEIKKTPTTRDIGLMFKNGDDKNLPPEKRGLQTPRIFYRRELEIVPLIVAKP